MRLVSDAMAVGWMDTLSRSRRDLWVVFAVALLLRLIYFAQYAGDLPFLYGPIADSIVYLEQGFHVRRGELGAPVLLAFSPLYGYFLALVGATSSLVPVLLQLLSGCVTALLLYVASERLGGRVAARFSAGLYLGYGTFLYYESKILSESLSMLLVMIALTAYLSAGTREGKFRPSMVSGVFFGLAVLARASLVFASPILVLVAALPWQQPRESVRVLVSRASGVALGLTLVFGGNGAVTYAHTGLFVPVILVSRTIEASAANAFDGQLSSVKFGGGDASSYDVVGSARRRIADAHNGVSEPTVDGPGIDLVAFLKNAPTKVLQTLSPREITFQYGYNGERDHIALLQWLPVSFGVLLLWGAWGAFALARARGLRALLPLLPLIAGVFVTTTLYHPSTRYRLAMTLPLFLCAGFAFATVAGSRATIQRRGIIILYCATILLVGLHVGSRGYNRAEFAIQLAMSAGVQGDRAARHRYAQQAAAFAPTNASIQRRANALQRDH